MGTEDNDAMNGYDARKEIIEEGDHPVPKESGKDRTSPKEGGKTAGKAVKLCAMFKDRALAEVGNATRKKMGGVKGRPIQ